MIRVLELVASSRGGGAVHIRDLATYLDPDRFTVTVAMPEDRGNVAGADFEARGIAFHQLEAIAGLSLKPLPKLRRLFREKQIDILHCHGARAALYGRVAAVALGESRPRIVYTIHGFAAPHYAWTRRTTLRALERLLAPLTDAVIAVSEAERKAFLRTQPLPGERIHVVLNGIDTAPYCNVVVNRPEQRAALGVPIDAQLVTTICRLYRPRDFDTLLTAFTMVRAESPNVHLLVVGDGPYRQRVEALVSKLNLIPHVTLAGFRRDIPQILAASDIFVLSTAMWEGLPLTILEAMASGLPVVASDVGGIGEEVVHQQTGMVVPPRDPPALAQALLDLLTDSQKATAMGKRGRQRVYEFFTLERMGRETMAVYEGLMGG
ncbi:MAG: glycosyltransferase [Anaerolineae bacterium]|nr:glycosyltransferase [Anaerolineae bacterium]NIN94276.1 glycosyltransferase [Anaerolineae bacterium]NIQ77344.1 glycosyltransferase [Anaerolineae bacterium]